MKFLLAVMVGLLAVVGLGCCSSATPQTVTQYVPQPVYIPQRVEVEKPVYIEVPKPVYVPQPRPAPTPVYITPPITGWVDWR